MPRRKIGLTEQFRPGKKNKYETDGEAEELEIYQFFSFFLFYERG